MKDIHIVGIKNEKPARRGQYLGRMAIMQDDLGKQRATPEGKPVIIPARPPGSMVPSRDKKTMYEVGNDGLTLKRTLPKMPFRLRRAHRREEARFRRESWLAGMAPL